MVNVGNTICCKKWKNKTAKCQPQVDEIEKVLDCQDEDEKAPDSFIPESVADIPIADAILKEITTEPDWMKRFYKVKDADDEDFLIGSHLAIYIFATIFFDFFY